MDRGRSIQKAASRWKLVLPGVKTDQNWLSLGIDVPPEFIGNAMKSRGNQSTGRLLRALMRPPAFATDEDLSSYPSWL